jgi:tRNA A-37 threonylcarbamoyl transferase component Bud32
LQSSISADFLASPQYLPLLNQHQLASFAQIWAFDGSWFEPPNKKRGGWSGVNFIELADNNGKKTAFYLKRQENFMRRSLQNPIFGEPTFVREYTILQHLAKHHVNAPKIAFFGSQTKQAILMTEALAGYIDLDAWLAQNQNASILRKKQLIAAIASTVKKLHFAGVQHRSLYPKHLFVNENDGFKVAVIDFEKSRITPFISHLKLSDLKTLSGRLPQISRTQKLYFLKQYFEVPTLNAAQKRIYRQLAQK